MNVLIDIPGSSRKRLVRVLTDGSLFGEMGLIDGEPRSARVVAATPSACISIGATKLASMQGDHPDIALLLLRNATREFAERLRIADRMMSELER